MLQKYNLLEHINSRNHEYVYYYTTHCQSLNTSNSHAWRVNFFNAANIVRYSAHQNASLEISPFFAYTSEGSDGPTKRYSSHDSRDNRRNCHIASLAARNPELATRCSDCRSNFLRGECLRDPHGMPFSPIDLFAADVSVHGPAHLLLVMRISNWQHITFFVRFSHLFIITFIFHDDLRGIYTPKQVPNKVIKWKIWLMI